MTTLSSNQLLSAIELELSIGTRVLCRGLSVQMTAGQSWSVLGPNGSGKSTLLQALAGLRPLQSGRVLLAGRPLNTCSHRQLALQRSILFQKTDDAFPASVLEAVLAGRHPHIPYWQTETEDDRRIARQALAKVDMEGFEERDILSLSGGERQRVAIAACFAQQAKIRLFDEPANHLDMKHQSSILELISDNQGGLNVIVLQDINQAWRYTSHALLLYPDGSTESGCVTEMLTLDRLQALYGCRLKIIEHEDERIFMHA